MYTPRMKRFLKRWMKRSAVTLLMLIVVAGVGGSVAATLEKTGDYPDWRRAWDDSDFSAGLSPDPATHRGAVVQAFAARTWGAKKIVAVHTWVAVKPKDADVYTIHEVIGWRARRGLPVVVASERIPDRPWYGNRPTLLLDIRGVQAESLIDRISEAATSYPWANDYTAWPGPNSNTFIAWIGREVPELGLDLPSTAIGKDYVPLSKTFSAPTTGTGVQASLMGLASVSIGREQGLELNLLGLNVELDLLDLAVELPGFGRIGAPEVSTKEPPGSPDT